jgi:hypothetical protein
MYSTSKSELVFLGVTFKKGFSNNKLDVKFKEEKQ